MLALIITVTYSEGVWKASAVREGKKESHAYSFTNEKQAERNLEIIAGAAIEELIKDAALQPIKEHGHVA